MKPIASIPSVSVTYARDGRSTKANSMGMRPMQERAYPRTEKRGGRNPNIALMAWSGSGVRSPMRSCSL